MGYLGYYLLASIIVSFGIIIRTVTKSEQARRRLSYIALSGIIVLLMLFSFAHAYNLLDQSALLVIFLALFPLFSLSYLFATYTLLELTGRERVCLLLYVTHTFVLLGIIAYLSWHVVGTPLTIPLFCHYIIVSTIAGWIVGLVWTWRKFRKITEFAQVCAGCYLLSSIILVLALFVNLAVYPICGVLWSAVFLFPYLLILSNLFLKESIAYTEKILQSFLIEITIFAVYYFALTALALIPRGVRVQSGPLCCNPVLIAGLLGIVFTYSFIRKGVEKLFKRVLFRPVVNYRLLFRNFSNALLAFVDIKKIIEVVVSILHDGYDVSGVSCFLYDVEERKYVLEASVGEDVVVKEFGERHPLVSEIRKRFRVILKESISRRDTKEAFSLLMALKAEVAIPFQYKDGYVGFVFLGKKKDGSRYDDDDIELFSMLEGQISVALNNALFFKTQHESYELMAQKNKMDAVIALSSGVNHEINNPLSIISMKSQNFLRKISEEKFASQEETIKEATDVIDSALRNAGRAHMITRRLGDFARPAKDVLDPEDLDIKEYIHETVALIGEKRFAQDSIELVLDIPEKLDKIRCDKSHLRQILFNVIMNAYHAIGREGKIIISAQNAENGFVCLQVTDTGCGIKAEELSKIWEPFFTTKPQQPLPENKFTGTGLGLALVKRYIEHSGGRVDVTSTEGAGTSFYLYFQRVHKKKEKDEHSHDE